MAPHGFAHVPGRDEGSAGGGLKVVVDREFALSEAGTAHAYIEGRQAFGRVLLVP